LLASSRTAGAAADASAGAGGRGAGRLVDGGGQGFDLGTAGGSLEVSRGASLPAHNTSQHYGCKFSP